MSGIRIILRKSLTVAAAVKIIRIPVRFKPPRMAFMCVFSPTSATVWTLYPSFTEQRQKTKDNSIFTLLAQAHSEINKGCYSLKLWPYFFWLCLRTDNGGIINLSIPVKECFQWKFRCCHRLLFLHSFHEDIKMFWNYLYFLVNKWGLSSWQVPLLIWMLIYTRTFFLYLLCSCGRVTMWTYDHLNRGDPVGQMERSILPAD